MGWYRGWHPRQGENNLPLGCGQMGERLPETQLLFPVFIVVRKPATVNGFPHFLLFPNFSSVNLCIMTVPREFLSAVIRERTSSLFSFASTAVSITREILFGVSLILPIVFGLDGLLWSFPAAGLLTFIIAIFFIRQAYLELKNDLVFPTGSDIIGKKEAVIWFGSG